MPRIIKKTGNAFRYNGVVDHGASLYLCPYTPVNNHNRNRARNPNARRTITGSNIEVLEVIINYWPTADDTSSNSLMPHPYSDTLTRSALP